MNFCLPEFRTSVSCNKLCADGGDASNLVSSDPAARRRGFRVEYFLRPPVHVTLCFRAQVELWGVDVELWPQAGSAGRMELLTSSDLSEDGAFQMVGRCELRDGVLQCFRTSRYRHQTLSPPEPPPHACQQELWSRGWGSLGAVAQLRVSIPFIGTSSVLGIKSLAVWGVPARCCSPSEREMFQRLHSDSMRTEPSAAPSLSPGSTSGLPQPPKPASSVTPIPEEFLDPLTQELMVLPMILPSGKVVDSSTLEEYQKHEASWGRLPNDPFTGVPFTKESKPLPNPLLKQRIDLLTLQSGRTGGGNILPRASRLLTSSTPRAKDAVVEGSWTAIQGPTVPSVVPEASEKQNKNNVGLEASQKLVPEADSGGTQQSSRLQRKRNYSSRFQTQCGNTNPQTANPTTTELNSGQVSHEQRLSQSLDEALSSALYGLPLFTSQSAVQSSSTTDVHRCGSCSCFLDIYSSAAVYSLSCGHLMCGPCLQHQNRSNSSNQLMTCPRCKECAPPSSIVRVHH